MNIDQKSKRYLLDCLSETTDGEPLPTYAERIAYAHDRFRSEYKWAIATMGEQRACEEWLQGLALPIAFYNHDIIELAKSWGSIPQDATARQEDKIIDNYWRFMAAKLCQLHNGYRVPKQDD